MKPILDAAATPEAAVTEIEKRYPGWLAEEALQETTARYFKGYKK